MATIKSFEDIESWKKARQVCKTLGEYIDNGKFKKSYRLIHQIEGSSGSIMDNIAEGFERGIRAEFITFLGYAKGSCGNYVHNFTDRLTGVLLQSQSLIV